MKKLILCVLLLLTLAACDIPEAHQSATVAIEQTFPRSQWGQAEHTAWCESRYVFNATNHNHWGIFQIWGGWAPELEANIHVSFWATWMDPYWNAQFALYIEEHYGWGQWEDVCV